MPHLVRVQVMLEHSRVDVVIGRVAIDEPVKEQSIEGKSPVGGRWCVLMARPFSPIMDWICRCLVFIQIILHIGWVVLQRSGCEAE